MLDPILLRADWLVILIYLVVLTVIGIFAAKARDLDDYLIHRGRTGFFLLLGSALSTLVGAGTVFGMFEIGYERGLTAIGFGLALSMGLLLTAAVSGRIKQVQVDHSIKTLPDFLRIRFSSRCAAAAGVLNLFAFLFFASAQFLGLKSMIVTLIPANNAIALVIVGTVAVLYTVSGGLRADILTDFVQFIIMGVLLSLVFWFLAGGLDNQSIFVRIASLPDAHNISWSDFGFTLGSFVLIAPSFPVAMDIWQRILAADSAKTARRFLIWSAASILFFFAGFGLLGVYYSGADLHGQSASVFAVERLIELVQTVGSKGNFAGILGFLVVGFLATVQSTLGSMLLVASLSLSHDLMTRNRSRSEKTRLWISRLLLVIFGVICYIVATIFADVTDLMASALGSLAILFPSVVWGLYSKKGHEARSFWSIVIGFSALVIIALIMRQPILANSVGVLLSWTVFALFPYFETLTSRARTSDQDESK